MAETRDRLLDEAELLFAVQGIQGTATREIVAAAGQRNPSAISYHFGSRQNLLLEVLARRGGPVDDERGRRRDQAGLTPAVRDLVACLVVPYAELLGTGGGRAYVRIVAQLRGRFAAWRVESDASTTKHLARILDELESQVQGAPAVRRERIVGMVVLLTGVIAERAGRLEDDSGVELDHAAFVENLIDMCAGTITA